MFMASEISKVQARGLPEYEASVKAESTASSGGIAGAFTPMARGYEALGAMGASIASTAANQRAELAALREAQNPDGRTPIPGFTDADAHYAAVYNQESFNTLTNIGQENLDRAYREYASNPTPQGLAEFEQIGQDTIQQMGALGTERNRAEIERSLKGVYRGQFNRLSQELEHKNRQEMRANYEGNTQSNLDRVLDFEMQGMTQEADELVAQQAQANRVSTAAGIVTPREAQKTEAQLRQAKFLGSWIRQVKTAEAEKGETGADEVLADYAKAKPEGMSFTEYEAVGEELLGYVRQQRSLRSGMDRLKNAQLDYDIATGKITNLTQLSAHEGEISAYDYLKHAEKIAQIQTKINGEFATTQAVKAAMARNDGSINDFSPQAIQQTFNTLLEAQTVENGGTPPGIPEQAQIMASMNRPVQSFYNLANNAIIAGSEEVAVPAMESLVYVSETAPQAFEMKDPQARSIFEMAAARHVDAGVPWGEALAQARLTYVENEKRTEQLSSRFTAILGSRDNMIDGYFEDLFNVNPGDEDMRAYGLGGYTDAYYAFTGNMRDYFLSTGDINVAYQATKRDMANNWGQSAYGLDPLMKAPPEKRVADIGLGHWFDNQFGFLLQDVARRGDEAVQKGIIQKNPLAYTAGPEKRLARERIAPQSGFERAAATSLGLSAYLRSETGAQSDGFTQEEFFREPLFGRTLQIEGKDREIFLRSNRYTNTNNTTPTYYLYYRDDFGQPQPVPDYLNGGFVSWVPATFSQTVPAVQKRLQEGRIDDITDAYIEAQSQSDNTFTNYLGTKAGVGGRVVYRALKALRGDSPEQKSARELVTERLKRGE